MVKLRPFTDYLFKEKKRNIRAKENHLSV